MLSDHNIPGKKGAASLRSADLYADRLDALRNLTFLMRVDIDRREQLKGYLQYMDTILKGMTEEAMMRNS